ncbi:MAG: helix-turn-helix transcriptional regulator [Deltaproteobacteria bacterium]|nr:helix-turn-helix transcriptional regulator [Deltaproteobacteria bacterium]MCB9785101.1 helix-turn-helix transcriptional regulator [Deltaproteobacteria bacterium]
MKSEKVTKAKSPLQTRWYDDACGTALAMELIGERWSLLIVRELMFGPRRFGELRSSLGGISANVLTQRLAGLAAAGILGRRTLPPPANAPVYELTEWGYECEPAIQALGRWAARSPDHDPSLPLSAASLMLSFRTMIDRSRSGQQPMTVGFRLGADRFVARVDARGIDIRRDEPADAALVFVSDPVTVASVVYGGRPMADAEAAGTLSLTGDRALAEHFITLFPLPPKVD